MLALYAEGGLNCVIGCVQRYRVLAPFFVANGIYPLFFTWMTGAGDTIK